MSHACEGYLERGSGPHGDVHTGEKRDVCELGALSRYFMVVEPRLVLLHLAEDFSEARRPGARLAKGALRE